MPDISDNCPNHANTDQNDANGDGSGDACDCFPFNHCQNDAECEADFQNFSCACTLGFQGRLCDADIDDCTSTSCANGSTCIDLIGMTRCDCPPGYWGIRCELPSQYTSSVVEAANNSFVVQLTPTDPDDFSTSVLLHEIVSGNEQGLFLIDKFSGNITATAEIDRETADVHVLTVEVTEPRNDPPLVGRRTTAQVTVRVDDINDNTPVFVRNEWNVNVQHGKIANTVVITVTATDRDLGSNAQLIYSIVPGPGADFFWIDPIHGTVSLSRRMLWSSLLRNITMWIHVRDRGQPPLAAETLAAVYVCPPGYIGPGCGTGEQYVAGFLKFQSEYGLFPERDECVPNPCGKYGLYCLDKFADYECVCRTGYTSKRCKSGTLCIVSSVLSSQPLCSLIVVETLCQNESTNCSSFLRCALAAFPCTQDSYFDNSLAPFCDAVNVLPAGSSGRQWAESTSNCLVQEVVRYLKTANLQFRKSAPVPSECRALESYMFYSAHWSCFSSMIENATFTADEARRFLLKAFPTHDRDRSLLLNLVSQQKSPSEDLLTLKAAIEEIGFVVCASAEVDNNAQIKAIADQISAKVVDPTEQNCGNTTSASFRSFALKLKSTGPDVCANASGLLNFTSACPECGDGTVDWPVESCDDGNIVDDDGCSSSCHVESLFDCAVVTSGRSSCYSQICGDGVRVAGEDCDTAGGTGCSGRRCVVEDGYNCRVDPYQLSVCTPICGDGIIVKGEDCDDHNSAHGDGCNSKCEVEIGYTCTETFSNGTSICTLKKNYTCTSGGCFYCGNEIYEPPEECDNGVRSNSVVDGCDDRCRVLQFFECESTVGDRSECRHFTVDFSREDKSSLGRSAVFTYRGEVVFLAKPDTLNATRFGPEVSLEHFY